METRTTRPTPSDREVDWNKTKVLLSKTDTKGTILYANEAFIDVSGYDEFELIGQPHNVIRHPDMPKVIFKFLWDNIRASKNIHAIIKNMSKTGRYYWVITDFKIIADSDGEIAGFFGTRKSVPEAIIVKFIEPLYKKLIHIEEASGVKASEEYLIGFLEERNKTYMEYVDHLVATGKDDKEKVKKGFFKGFFEKKDVKKK
ncbi:MULTISPECIES: PAS domain-containing protein [unclassified Flavobacterium]|jgi:PAS domain S-box-containing protein|uniref:PAS domain-containing protein n=1 Tax=unclassified Flavobacterium TaxID=196869 RepID=UPI00057F855E|nr:MULTISPECIES: PAS domain-containing protein [unclassified Flavobacterium]KIA97258.1 histidine kinase [Flavobacterium sp. KMS]KIA99394.1 histidine kinase [Flavobacterium sp. JRM]MEA9412564.1 PAS domain-containing protein [Flavobacterium sp. PL02]OUL62879.1 histidine kinase [Flavobacterium sp. AJR]